MKRSALTYLALFPCVALGTTAGAQGRPLVITQANLIDGPRGAFATNATIVIRDGRIAEVTTVAVVARPTPSAPPVVRRPLKQAISAGNKAGGVALAQEALVAGL